MAQQIQLGISADIPQTKPAIKFRSKYQQWKYENNYRKADQCSDIRCENCKHLFKRIYSRNHYKCNLLGFSSSQATDIRLSCTCKNFEMEVEECT